MAFHLPSVSALFKGTFDAFRRFPLAILTSVLATGIFIFMIDLKWSEEKDYEYLWKVVMCCWLGFNLFLALSLFSERQGHGFVMKYILQVTAMGLVVGYYFLLPDFRRMTITDGTRYALFSVGLHLLVAFAPFIGKGEINGFWQFNKNLFLRFLLSALYTGVFYVGLALALLAIDKLFNVKVRGERYAELWVFLAGIFNTWFFLAGVPSNLDEMETDTEYPKGLKIFTQFVLLPLVAVYLLILYAYGVKIIIEWELPKGWVSYLVNAFSVFGILSLLLIYPIRNEEGNKWMNIFSRWFYRALFPLIILLGVAISKRVFQYGITENRYFVLVVALWLAGMASYFLLSKVKNIKVIPVSLCLIAFLSSFGPWGAFSVSERSQVNRLEKLLIKEKILVDGKIKKATDTIPRESGRQIVAIVHYLDDHHHFDAIKPWFKEDLDSVLAPKDSSERMYRVYEEGRILALMGVEDNYYRGYGYDEEDDTTREIRNFNYYAKDRYSNEEAVPVAGFDYSCTVNRYFYDYNNSYYDNSHPIRAGRDTLTMTQLKDKKKYGLVRNERDTLYFDLEGFVKKISDYNKENKESQYDNGIPRDKMIIEAQSGMMHMRLYVTNVSGTISKTEGMTVTNLNGTMLVKFGVEPPR